MPKSIRNGLFLAFGGIFVFTLAGCQSWGFKRGYKDAARYYRALNNDDKFLVWSYPYGYMRGWNWYQLERARDMKRGMK